MADLKNVDIYKVVDEMNKNKVSDNSKLDEIYNMLDSINADGSEKKSDIKLTLNNDVPSSSTKIDQSTNATTRAKTATLSDYKEKVRAIRKPSFPSEIRAFDTRSECFFNILQEVDYGTNNNEDYVKGHKDALDKYFTIAKNNTKNFYVVEGQVNDELNVTKNNTDNYARGYYDGLEFVYTALNKSKSLLSTKIYNELLKELS